MSVTAVPIRPIRKGSLVKLWAGIGALCLVAAGLAWAGTREQVAKDPESYLAANAKREGVVTTPSGLQFKVIEEGSGISPTANDMVLVEYEGRLADGTVFDASARHGGPAPLPVSGVIPGWSEGLTMMKKGGKYRLWIPPELGYGPQGAGNGVIPPDAVLDFDVTLLDVAPQAAMGPPPGVGAAPGSNAAPPPTGGM